MPIGIFLRSSSSSSLSSLYFLELFAFYSTFICVLAPPNGAIVKLRDLAWFFFSSVPCNAHSMHGISSTHQASGPCRGSSAAQQLVGTLSPSAAARYYLFTPGNNRLRCTRSPGAAPYHLRPCVLRVLCELTHPRVGIDLEKRRDWI